MEKSITESDGVERTFLRENDGYMYIIDTETDMVLSINDKMRECYASKDNTVGQICWKVLKNGRKARCDYCPMPRLLEQPDTTVVWEEHDEASNRYFRNVSSLIPWSTGKLAHLMCSMDITDIKQAEESMVRQLRQQELMTSICQSFSAVQNVKDMIFEALKAAGEFMGTNHALLSVYRREEGCIECISEWNDGTSRPYMEKMSKWPLTPDSKVYLDLMDKGFAAVYDYIPQPHQSNPAVKDYDMQAFLNIPVKVSGDFWGVLGFVINKRATTWSQCNIHLGKMIAKAFSDAITRSIAVKELSRAKEDAERASRHKGDFLSSMSHEIRTPMNAIIGMTQIAKNSGDSNKIEYCLERIDSASQHLLSLINDILDLSKIEANKIELSAAEFDLEGMLMNITSVVNFKIEEKKQNIIIHIDNDVPFALVGDELRLGQVITNLLTNAAKFTPERGRITITIRTQELTATHVTLLVEVSDTGIGMTPEQISRVFCPFEQAEADTVRNYGGTGLGLPICKGIVEAMGGHIWIESEPDKGSMFSFTVRLAVGCASANAKSISIEGKDAIRILAIDDAPEIRDYFLHIMPALGLSCDVADCGIGALEMIRTERELPYNFFFIDWTLPDLNSLDLAREIRRLAPDDPIIIVISAHDWSNIEKEAAATGIKRFISKPLFPSPLINIINESLGIMTVAKTQPDRVRLYDFSKYTVLVAEDIEINREILSVILEDTYAAIDFAQNGLEAVQLYRGNPGRYNLILMDIQMPEMDGYLATQNIRAMNTPAAKKIPIIAMTANVFQEDVEKCFSAGMNDHIGKPIDNNELLAKINRYIHYNSAALFTQDMKTGIEAIDIQHETLIHLSYQIAPPSVAALSEEEMKESLCFLEYNIVTHFKDEEDLQLESQYPRYRQHKEVHDEFIHTFRTMCEKYEKHGASEELSAMISRKIANWIVNHIKVEDVRFGTHYTQFKRQQGK